MHNRVNVATWPHLGRKGNTVKITLQQLQHSVGLTRVVIHSLDFSIYLAYADFGAEPLLVTERLAGVPLPALFLRHQSAYDEMVGQPLRTGDNSLEVPLARDWGDFPEGQ